MAQQFDDLFAELGEATASLQRTVKKCRTLIGDRRPPPPPSYDDGRLFGWSEPKKD